MKNTNFINSIPLRTWMRVVGILLVVLYAFLIALWVWGAGYITIEFGLFLVSLISAFAVLFNKEWARRALVAVSGLGFIFNLINMIWLSKAVDDISILFGLLFASIIYFYQRPFIKAEFQRPGIHLPRKQILLIDDDKTLLRMMSANFQSKGITLLTAETGEKGLALARNKEVDLIILDVILPKMKGREVCQRLKEDNRTKDIPIIFLTVKHSADDVQAEFEAGAVSHLTKPVDFSVLYKEISKILGV